MKKTQSKFKFTLFTILLLMTFNFALPAEAKEGQKEKGKTCQFDLKSDSAQVEWTAFKTTQKVGVKGKFNEVKITAATPSAPTLEKSFRNLKFEINGASVNSGNPGRDETLSKGFFALLPGGSTLHGKIIKTDFKKKKATVQLQMEKVKKTITLNLEKTDALVKATGTIDMLQLAMKKAYDGIHKTCENLHKGADGVSKTWSTVELEISVAYTQTCND